MNTGEAEVEFGNDSAGGGKTHQKWPVALPLALEEDGPWIEQSRHRFFLSPSFLKIKIARRWV